MGSAPLLHTVGRLLLIAGLTMAALGVMLLLAGKTPIGRLPGDFLYRRGPVTLYFPLMSALLLSALLTLMLWLFRR